MERVRQVKHWKQKKLKREVKVLSIQLKKVPQILVYTSLLHQIKIAVKSRIKSIAKSHGKIKKWSNFRKRHQESDVKSRNHVTENTMHNFLLYTLSDDETMTPNFGLDQHIAYTVNHNFIITKFELFYQNILNISHISKQNLAYFKTKLQKLVIIFLFFRHTKITFLIYRFN